ncbi:hypothetical protein PV327_007734 [Microctonus hyperodae]|uniref:Uncharacterized protein n=1 Tax=Microctonus hyperodae TaxID=165561 RepID=A0AA39FZU1_MICHY|nr:hypothetical protein PV327_007734 [Microctonus hyperodae]
MIATYIYETRSYFKYGAECLRHLITNGANNVGVIFVSTEVFKLIQVHFRIDTTKKKHIWKYLLGITLFQFYQRTIEEDLNMCHVNGPALDAFIPQGFILTTAAIFQSCFLPFIRFRCFYSFIVIQTMIRE